MTKRILWIFLILALVGVMMTGCGLLREPAAPSEELEAVPLELEEPSEEPVESVEGTEPQGEVEEAGSQAEPEQEEETAAAGLVVFTIDPGTSEVRFELDEVLRGEDVTVVGTTDQIAGEIGVDFNDLAATQLGVITINARGLLTDNNFRNRAIQNEILDTGEFEFITFEPTAVNGLPQTAAVGDTVEFTIDGDLTIRDITQPATFTASITVVSDSQLQGSANTIIAREDYNLNIPEVPSVANVEPEVELYIDFVANAS